MIAKITAISIESQPNQQRLEKLDVFNWPIWEKEASEFPWTYDQEETCYFLEGDVIVIPTGGDAVSMGKGDLVTFPAGMSCTWKINRDLKKHYKFN
jgi:uncharacterized protein